MSDDKGPPPPYASPGPWMLAKTTTTTKVTTTTTETHFFPLFRRRPNARVEHSAAASLRKSIDLDKALPPPPSDSGSDSHGLGLGLPHSRKSVDRDITPRAADRDITPTPPMPTIIPSTPQPRHIALSRDVRRVRSSGTIRDAHPERTRRSEHNARNGLALPESPVAPFSAPPQRTTTSGIPRTRQPATSLTLRPNSGPSSSHTSDSRSPQAAIPSTGLDQMGFGRAPPVVLLTGEGSSSTGTYGAGTTRDRPIQGLEREQNQPAWESQTEFGRLEQPTVSRSLGPHSNDRGRDRERRPSAPATAEAALFSSLKGKNKERDSPDLDLAKEKEGGRRSFLGRRPSFWTRRAKPKEVPGRPSTSQPDVQHRSQSNAGARRSLDITYTGPSTSRQDIYSPPPPRRIANASILPRSTATSARSSIENTPDLSLPTVRPMTPLFSEFGVYRASVDFAAAGGPTMMTALAERLAAEGVAGVTETIPERPEADPSSETEPTQSSPIPVPDPTTPPRRRATGTGSLGRAASWRRSLVGSAENWRRSLIGGTGEEARADTPNGYESPARASTSPVPWRNSSPRASPIPRRSMHESISGSGRDSPARGPRHHSPEPISRQGSPIPPTGMMSPIGSTRVTFGEETGRQRLESLPKGQKDGVSTSTAAGGGKSSLRRVRSTSRLTAALSPTRRRSFSLFGSRPRSAGSSETQQTRQQTQQRFAPSASGPSMTDMGLTLTLSPPMVGPGGSYPLPSPSLPGSSVAAPPGLQPFSSVPGSPVFTQPSGSQLSLAYGGSSIGHSPNGFMGSSGVGTYVAGSPSGSRASSILLRSPLRPRSITNPPLLRRLSGVFGSAGSAGRNASGIVGDGIVGGGLGVSVGSGITMPSSKGPSPSALVPKREDDTPDVYLNRLVEAVNKSEIAGVLASKADSFHAAALRLYMARFDFVFDPLDIALRRLLMDMGLPKETQHIDRVMEAFAKRYMECNPGLFVGEDHAYILAFSLIMLHTDAFNKSNKNKMTKADYVKNTRMTGIPQEVLDYFFDNIVFAPFIFIEDATDVNGQKGFIPEPFGNKGSALTGSGTSSTLLNNKPKVDPYYMISQNMLGPLRVPVDQFISPVSPFSFTGTADNLNAAQLRRVFACNTQLEIAGSRAEPVRIGVNKSGLLARKEDLVEGGRKASNRKWRRWAVVLTGSQLLFFRPEASGAALVLGGTESKCAEPVQTNSLKPDEVVSLKDAIALYDVNYTKYTHVFRFMLPTGKQQLMQAANEQDMNEWISRINYASALKTAGVRVRELAMNDEETRATGIAAAVSHVRDRRLGKPAASPSWNNTTDLEEDCPQTLASFRSSGSRSNVSSEVELDATVEPTDGGMKDTFDEIKAELAATHNTFPRSGLAPPRQTGHRATSLGVQRAFHSSLSSVATPEDSIRARMTTRAEVVTSKIADLKSKIDTTEMHLQNELRVVRNLAVLSPFQQATRARIRLAIESLGRRIQVVRMDMAKMACHRDVLIADLAAEEDEREQLKTIALQAAREQLLLSVPRMRLSVHEQVPEEDERRLSRPGSDASGSASPSWDSRSATDYPDPAEDPTLRVGKNDTSLTTPEIEIEQLDPAPRKSDTSLRPRPSFAASSRSGVSQMSSSGNPQPEPEPTNNAEEVEEEAEAWNATRAGRRVSLVQIPPPPNGRRLSDLLRKRRDTKDTIGEGEADATPT